MDGYDSMFGMETSPPKPEPAPKVKKPKRDREAEPRLGDKLLKFLQPWSWEVHKGEKKPLKFPVINDIVSLDRVGWRAIRNASIGVGATASFANLMLVTVFACTIASQSTFGLLENAPWWITGPVWFILMVMATAIAAVLQLATDFGLPWASGLAFEKYKISPTAIIVLWLTVFMPTTFIMKFDLYASWAHARQAEIVQKQTEDVNDANVLAKFASGPPPGIEASQAIIAQSPGLLKDMRAERDRLVSARDQEKRYLGSTETGMGPKWNALNDQVQDVDKRIEAQAAASATAATALQDRMDYDAARARQEANAKITAHNGSTLTLWYDQTWAIVLRVLGGEFASIISIIVAFVALKKTEEHKEAEAAKAEASERAKKGWYKRRQNASTFEGDFEEAAPINAPKIEDQGPVASAAVARADTQTQQVRDTDTHPDRTGDAFGAKTSDERTPPAPEPEPEPEPEAPDLFLSIDEASAGDDSGEDAEADLRETGEWDEAEALREEDTLDLTEEDFEDEDREPEFPASGDDVDAEDAATEDEDADKPGQPADQ